LRQWILLNDSLFWAEDYRYLLVCSVAVAMGIQIRFVCSVKSTFFRLIENLSMAVFIAIGYTVAMVATNSLTMALALGICTGLGGGVIRDVLMATVPNVLTDTRVPVLLLASYTGIYAANTFDYDIWIGSCLGVLLIEMSLVFIDPAKQPGRFI